MQPENLKIKVPRLGRNRYGVYYVRASALDPAGRRKVRQLSLRTKDPHLARVLALEFCLLHSSGSAMAGIDRSLWSNYEFDLSTGTFKAEGADDHARMMEAARLAAELRERQELREENARLERISRDPYRQTILELINAVGAEAADILGKDPRVEPSAAQASTTTLRAAFAMHMVEERRHVAKQTAHEKDVLFDDFMDCFGAETPLNDVTLVDVTTRWRPAEIDRPNKKRPGEKVSLARLEKRRGFLSKFFQWAIKGGLYAQVNPVAEAMAKKSEIRKARKSYAEFTADDLATLFSPAYLAFMDKPDWYWPPLMALLSGARLGELTDLELSGFEVREGIKIFEIRDGKTKESKRVVPVHERLLELGLWEYVQALKDAGAVHLFPHRSENYRSKSTGRAWHDWVEECGFANSGKSFHSFRSTAITDLHNENAGHAQIRRAVGHAAVGVSGAHGGYVRGIELVKLKDAIHKLNFPTVDFTLLKRADPTFAAFFAAEACKAENRAAKEQSQARHDAAVKARAERNARGRKKAGPVQAELKMDAPGAGTDSSS